MIVKFIADKVKVKTGRVDNSAVVEFEVGEYQLDKIKELVGVIGLNLKVTVQDEKV
jgi:hypothetical protein